MQARAGRANRPWQTGVALAAVAALLTACDLGGAPAPTPTPIAATTGTPAAAAATAPPTSTSAAASTATPAPTDTAAPPSPTVPPQPPTVPPTAARSNNTTPGLSWRLMGLTGQELFVVGGPVSPGAPVYVSGTGVYRSDDQGGTWNQLGFDNRTLVEEIVVSPSNPQVMYAGSGLGCSSGLPGGQFRSTDAGTTWKPLKTAPASLQVDPKNADVLTAIACDGVVHSTDGGQTWTHLADPEITKLGTVSGDIVRVPAADTNTIYATYVSESGNSRVRVSTDGGKTWAGDATDYVAITDLLVDAKRPARAWMVGQKGIMRTVDTGQTWLSSVTGLDAAHETSSAGPAGPYQLSALSAQYNTSGDLVELYVGSYGTEKLPGAGIFASRDAGQVWSRFGGDLGGRAIHSLHVTQEKGDNGPDLVVLYAATDDGIHKISLGNVH